MLKFLSSFRIHVIGGCCGFKVTITNSETGAQTVIA